MPADTLNVRTVTFDSVAETPVYSAPATVIARNEPQLAAEIEARIVALPVDVGDRVEAGALLARFDCRRNKSLLAAAHAERERTAALRRFADDQLARARDLKRKKNISAETFDQRRTDLATALADFSISEERIHQAQIDVDNCELRAPFDGVVTQRVASVGAYANRGMIVVGLIQTIGQEVSVALRQGQVDSLVSAASLVFEHDNRRHAVSLRSLLPNFDPTTRTREARLAFDAEPAPPGTAGRLVWQGKGHLLPAEFLVRREGQLGVFLLDGDTARFHRLPAAQDGRPELIDFAPGTLLISDGRQRVNDGDEVLRDNSNK